MSGTIDQPDPLMQQFSQFFVNSDTEEITQKELFVLFKDFAQLPKLTQQKFIWTYHPEKYWTKKVKRQRIGNGCRREIVVYKMKRKNDLNNDRSTLSQRNLMLPQPCFQTSRQPELYTSVAQSPFLTMSYPTQKWIHRNNKSSRQRQCWSKYSYKKLAMGASMAFISVSGVLVLVLLNKYFDVSKCLSGLPWSSEKISGFGKI